MDKRNSSAFEAGRKALHRKTVEELSTGTLLDEAVETALQPPNGTTDLDLLAYYITLLRQLTAVVSSKGENVDHVVELTHRRLGPALQPRGALTVLLMSCLSHPVKSYSMRSAETLTAATKLAAALPAPAAGSSRPYLLGPFFHEVLRDGLGPRGNLVALGIMIDSMPAEDMPGDLLDRLLNDFGVIDGSNVRCTAIVALLIRQKRERTGSEEEKNWAMFTPLLPLIYNDETAAQVLGRYLLPSLFKADRAAFPDLLNMLDQAGEGYFAAWVTTASFGVSSGIIGLDGLPATRLQEAMAHEDNRVRLMAFELVALSKSVLQPEVMKLVKQSLHWNAATPHPEGRTDMASAVYAFLKHLAALEHAADRDEKRAKTPEERDKLRANLDVAAAFHTWFLEEYLTPSIKQCREMPPLRAIFALKLLKLYLDVFGDRDTVITRVYTPERVTILIACQASEFAESRTQARAIIGRAPSPLPGYETLESASTRQLLASARASINHPRKTQAEAGRAALCIVFTKLVQQAGTDQAVAFVNDLVGLLEKHVVASEENLAKGIVEYPLHGLLSAITEVIKTLDLKSAAAQMAWKPVFHNLFTLVERIWAVTRKVISLGPSEDNDTAAHEIARAYEVLGDGDDEGDDLDHTNLLSGCCLATGQAAELLAVLVTLPLAHDQTVWSKDEIRRAGFFFLTWLHEIRHRGTFSRIAPALGSLCAAAKQQSELRDLVTEWLEHELETVAKGQLSTLRRSAGLPYSILAIVAGDEKLLDRTIGELNAMAQVKAATSDDTKVHAMNCLKIVLVDAKQTRFLPRYLEPTILVSLAAFASSNWNVRNVGLILLSTLAHRSMSTARSLEEFGSRAALAGRPTLSSWHARYPSLIPYITDYLRTSRRQGPASLTEHSPLFPILIILRSLRWSPDGEALADSLFPVVEPYLGSVEWQVREVASQALSSLLSPEHALEKAKITATRVSHPSDDLNTLHGRLLFLRRLFSDVINWPQADVGDRKLLELRLRDALATASTVSPVIPKAILDCIAAYVEGGDPESPSFLPASVAAAKSYLSKSSHRPGIDLLQQSAARVALLNPNDRIHLLSPSMPEDVQLLALDHIEQTPNTLNAVINLCNGSDAVRTKVFQVIASWPASSEIDNLFPTLLGHTESTCIPMREAALVAAGRACSSPSEDSLSALADRIKSAANEDEAEPSRAAAVASLSHLGKYLFNAKPSGARMVLHRALLTLLEDDDVDLRAGAAGIVVAGLELPRPIVPAYALQLWWEWLGKQDVEEWTPWLWELVLHESVKTQSDVLFVQEPPNMWRNPLTSAEYAANILAKMKMKPEDIPPPPGSPQPACPIDAGWAAAEIQTRQVRAYNMALGLS